MSQTQLNENRVNPVNKQANPKMPKVNVVMENIKMYFIGIP